MHSEVAKIVNEHKETYDENNLRDFTDAYIKQIKTSGDPGFTGTFCYYITYPFITIWQLTLNNYDN